MFRSPALTIIAGTVLVLGVMIGGLYWISRPTTALELYCAAAMLKPIQIIAADYKKETGQEVVLHPGPSQAILTQLELARDGDLFLPADESYMKQAQDKRLVTDIKNVADLQAVVIVRPGFDKDIKTFNDFVAVGKRIGMANPGAAAISSLTQHELKAQKLWDALAAAGPTYLGDVNEVGNSVVNTGSSDVGITWDALAAALVDKKPAVKIVRLKELDSVKARVQIAVATSTTQREDALRFIAYLRNKDKGGLQLKKAGYTVAAE